MLPSATPSLGPVGTVTSRLLEAGPTYTWQVFRTPRIPSQTNTSLFCALFPTHAHPGSTSLSVTHPKIALGQARRHGDRRTVPPEQRLYFFDALLQTTQPAFIAKPGAILSIISFHSLCYLLPNIFDFFPNRPRQIF